MLAFHGYVAPAKVRRSALPAAITVAFAIALFSDPESRANAGLFFPLFDAAVAVVLVAALGSAGRLSGLLSGRFLRFFGRISYALYLWHGMLLWATPLHPPEAAAVAIVAAWLSYRLVELPFLRLKERRYSSRLEPTAPAPRPQPPAPAPAPGLELANPAS